MSGEAEAGRKALEGVGKVLAERPKKDDHTLTEITKNLCSFRDRLIAARETGGPEAARRLTHLNAVISVVAGVHFPLGKVPWEELEKARDWLASLVEESAEHQPL